jgi:energy-converting hydrogenase Eha subunit E
MASYVSIAQGVFYLLTGVWPLVSMGTFERVTGPKLEHWLVKTVGVIIAVIGVGLLLAGWRGQVTFALAVIAVGAAGGLMVIDLIYVGKRVLSPIYLLDAAAEFLLMLAWALSWWIDAA